MSKEFVKAPELAKLCGVKSATIKFYSQVKILDYYQNKRHAHKIYSVEPSLNRIKEIKDLQNRGYSIEMIIKTLKHSLKAGLFN